MGRSNFGKKENSQTCVGGCSAVLMVSFFPFRFLCVCVCVCVSVSAYLCEGVCIR
jgi:hypothetical protein